MMILWLERRALCMVLPNITWLVRVLGDNNYFIFILFVCLRDLKMVGPISEVKD